jgi:hypothetical protein
LTTFDKKGSIKRSKKWEKNIFSHMSQVGDWCLKFSCSWCKARSLADREVRQWHFHNITRVSQNVSQCVIHLFMYLSTDSTYNF